MIRCCSARCCLRERSRLRTLDVILWRYYVWTNRDLIVIRGMTNRSREARRYRGSALELRKVASTESSRKCGIMSGTMPQEHIRSRNIWRHLAHGLLQKIQRRRENASLRRLTIRWILKPYGDSTVGCRTDLLARQKKHNTEWSDDLDHITPWGCTFCRIFRIRLWVARLAFGCLAY